MKQSHLFALAACAAGLCGCAQVKVSHVGPDDTSDGVHFYEPRPYLLVTTDSKKDDKGVAQTTYTSKVIWLPDSNKRYTVRVKPGWGTVDGSVKLVDGWMLSDFGAKADSKIPETITALTGVMKEAAAIAAVDPSNIPGLKLYRIDIAMDGGITLVPAIQKGN